MANHHEIANFIWSIADLLRGPYRPPQYERVMLPMDALIAAKEWLLGLLAEKRRAAVIAAAVTGRLAVGEVGA